MRWQSRGRSGHSVALATADPVISLSPHLEHNLAALRDLSSANVGPACYTHSYYNSSGWLTTRLEKERQFCILNDEERSVNGVRLGIDQAVDAENLLLSSLALLNPNKSTPYDGIFISSHTVKCDERGSTGESDSLKKVGCDQRISSRGQARYEGADTRSKPRHVRACGSFSDLLL